MLRRNCGARVSRAKIRGRLGDSRWAFLVATHENAVLPRSVGFATHVVPALGYAGLIFYTGLIRIGALPEVGFVATDKLLHALVFGGLVPLLARAAHWQRPQISLARKLWFGSAGASFLGLLLEVCQAFTDYRSADVMDWIADTVGALFAVGFVFALFAWLPRRAQGSRRAHG